MTKIKAIIRARMGSRRLPGKVLKKICGKSLLKWQVDRLKRSEMISKAGEKCKSLFEGDETLLEHEIMLQLKNLEKDIVRTAILNKKPKTFTHLKIVEC